jgi:aminopeptidase N
MSILAALLAVLPLAGMQAGTPSVTPDSGVVLSPRHYDLVINIDYASGTLQGTARIALQNPSNTPVSQVSLLLNRSMQVASATTEDGRKLVFTQQVVPFTDFEELRATQVLVELPQPLPSQAETTIQLAYGGPLHGYAETGMSYIQDHISRDFTILRDDAWAYPKPGYPSLAVLRSSAEASFRYRTTITVPADLVVANGGRLVAREEDGGKATYTYASVQPSWRMDFAIAPYQIVTAEPVRIYYLPGDAAGAERVGRAAQDALGLLARWFGPLATNDGLAFIEIPDGWGSQADVTTIIQTAAAFRDSTRLYEVYHEVSHLWAVPPLERPPPRIEEGLATFLSYRIAEEVAGRAAIDSQSTLLLERLRRGLPDHPRWREVPLIDYGAAELTDLSYRVGALFFYLMYRIEGPQAFDHILAAFYQQYGQSGATTGAFATLAERAAPVDLHGLFRDWIFGVGWVERVSESADLQTLLESYQKEPTAPR